MKFTFDFGRKNVAASRGKRRNAGREIQSQWITSGRLLSTLVFLLFAVAIISVCFVGNNPISPYLAQEQIARFRIRAEIEFQYTSPILTRQQVEARRLKIPPIYRLDLTAFHNFEQYLRDLHLALQQYREDLQADRPDRRFTISDLESFFAEYDPINRYRFNADSLITFYRSLSPQEQLLALDHGFDALEEIYRAGVYDPSESDLDAGTQTLNFFRVERDGEIITPGELLPLREAQMSLRRTISQVNLPREASVALYRILRSGLAPNLEFDEKRTREAIVLAESQVKPVLVHVSPGDTMVESGQRINALQEEQLQAYRAELERQYGGSMGVNPLLFEQSLLSFVILLSSVLCIRMTRYDNRNQWRLLFLIMMILLLQTSMARFLLELADSPLTRTYPYFISLLPWAIPMAIGPLIVSLLCGVGPALLVALLASIFLALMLGSSISVLVICFTASVIVIVFSRGTQARAKVVRAGLLSGLIVAVGALATGLRDQLDVWTIVWQMVMSVGTGAISGVIALGLLPLLESIFQFTTNITLLELTDFNHPLLRRMQMEAPGSYHHSLMVANLAENAAAAVEANPLLCRVCSYYHDIGKLIKPEYFIENQREGVNPHEEVTPSMSALIIKAHVKEGISLGRQYKLPQPVLDVIREHHGTSLIQYFYHKALEKRKKQTHHPFENQTVREPADVDESTYRYEGPKPHFLESAIIHLADTVEAASRSLRKVTPQAIEDLIDRLCAARLTDGQLDDAPLTLRELALLKASFTRTLTNMLHARIEYPSGASKPPGEKSSPPKVVIPPETVVKKLQAVKATAEGLPPTLAARQAVSQPETA